MGDRIATVKRCTLQEGEGRIKSRLRNMLAEQGFAVVLFWEQRGDYRIRKYEWDLACWGCSAYTTGKLGPIRKGDLGQYLISLASWDTMTECVRHGIVVEHEKLDGWTVHAKEK